MSKVRLYGDTSGFVELAAPDVSDDGVLTLPTAAQGILPANGGTGSNVVHTVVTAVFTTTSATFTPVTNYSVSITPSSATSKVLVSFSFRYATAASAAPRVRLMRGATQVSDFNSLGDVFVAHNNAANNFADVTLAVLDSPATASATTYSVEALTNASTLHIGSRGDGNAGQRLHYTITAIEVAA